jgi:hypothetical protein
MRLERLRLSAIGTVLGLIFVLAGLLSADTGPAHQVLQARPILLGTSGGSINDRTRSQCCGGTLGALVTDGSTQYVLSNNHVMARSNKGAPGDGILQPGLIDQAPVCAQDSNDVVATLSVFEPIHFLSFSNLGATNTVDAAIAQVVVGKVQSDGAILDIGTISTTPATAQIGMAVQKSGRTTGLTTGSVAAVNVTISVKYGGCGSGRGLARFTNQIRITPGGFSSGGDSGSVVLDDAAPPHAVGLLFAGSDTDTFANPIQSVLGSFGVSLVGASGQAGFPLGRWLGWLLPGRGVARAEAARPAVNASAQALARYAMQRHEAAIMQQGGVVGLGVGASELVPGEAAVEVYVVRDTSALRGALPAWLDGVSIKVVETGEITARTGFCPLDES